MFFTALGKVTFLWLPMICAQVAYAFMSKLLYYLYKFYDFPKHEGLHVRKNITSRDLDY
jgi:hypothetical protein